LVGALQTVHASLQLVGLSALQPPPQARKPALQATPQTEAWHVATPLVGAGQAPPHVPQ
jgi:hypothetical protein